MRGNYLLGDCPGGIFPGNIFIPMVKVQSSAQVAGEKDCGPLFMNFPYTEKSMSLHGVKIT